MPDKSCSIPNVMAKLGGVMDAGGVEMTNGAYEQLTPNGKLLFQEVMSQDKADILKVGKPEVDKLADQVIDETTQAITETSKVTLKGVITGSMKPSDLFPKEVIDPVLQYVDDFYVRNGGDIKGKHKAFISGAKSVLKSINETKVPEWARSEWSHYKRDLLDGHPFYEPKGNEWTMILNNTVGNAINLSNNVIMGNPLELLIKGPTLYGFRATTGGVLTEALQLTKGSLWRTVPELEARGLYGHKLEPSKNILKIPGTGKLNDLSKGTINLIMNTTQRPLINVAYAAGKIKGGTPEAGLEAVEKIAFMNRLGNKPRFFRSQASGNSLKVMNYTFSNYQMFGSLIAGLGNKETALQSAKGIGTYFVLTSAIGGPAAIIPKPFDIVLEKVEGYKDWRDENLTPAGKLIQPGNISVGAAQSIWNRGVESASKDFKNGAKNMSEGRYLEGIGDMTLGSLTLSIGFGQNIATNPRIQRSLRAAIDLQQQDISEDELRDKFDQIWNPLAKK